MLRGLPGIRPLSSLYSLFSQLHFAQCPYPTKSVEPIRLCLWRVGSCFALTHMAFAAECELNVKNPSFNQPVSHSIHQSVIQSISQSFYPSVSPCEARPVPVRMPKPETCTHTAHTHNCHLLYPLQASFFHVDTPPQALKTGIILFHLGDWHSRLRGNIQGKIQMFKPPAPQNNNNNNKTHTETDTDTHRHTHKQQQ